MHAQPQQEHQWLQKLVGEWRFDGEAPCAPGEAPQKFGGRESVKSLGGLWTVGEGFGDPEKDQPSMMSIMSLGYDPVRKTFVGSFIASVMTHLWIYERGELNAEKTTLTLEAEGPNFSGDGTMTKYQDIIEFVSDDHRILRSQFRKPDGSWQHFMTAHYHRTR
jgi:hypothetical protein